MENTYHQLLVSALALANDKDLIAHLEAANAYTDGPLVDRVNDGLYGSVHACGVDDEPARDMFELFTEDHPEISVLLPVADAPTGSHSPIVTRVHGLARKDGGTVKN